MPTPTTPAKPRKNRRRARPTLTGAVFGASATFLVLLATAIPDSPRQVLDIPESLAAGEMFDGSSLPAGNLEGDVHADTPAPERHAEPGLSLYVEVPA
jgi:hypothetical protein